MSPTQRKTLFSAAQPTGGGIMLGNYLGAVKNWVELQSQYQCLFSAVDMHSITLRQEPKLLRELSYTMVASYIACGIDPKKSLVFVQSHVPQHAELGWILTCYTNMGELNRMTQFKDKSAKSDHIPTGLFVYPSLMAADILLYQTHVVPVGSDQKQHLELARDLAQRMNKLYGPLFQVPEVFIPAQGARVMSLQDPTKKMSKSDEDASATVFLMDSDDVIMKKMKRAVTDSLNEIKLSDDQPGIKNLLSIQAAISGRSPQELTDSLVGKQYGYLKMQTADMIIALFRPMREEVQKLLADKNELDKILHESAHKAQIIADETLRKVCDALGFIPRSIAKL
jgi:tryptophanyl-tRNA synthetase